MTAQDYTFTEEAGHIVSITRSRDGADIPIDSENQDFCDFLSWASLEAASEDRCLHPDLGGLEYPGDFFASEDRLIDTCKRNGITLFAKAQRYGPTLQPESGSEARRYGRWRGHSPATFICLDQARASTVEDSRGVDGLAREPAALFVSPELMVKLHHSLLLRNTDLHRLTNLQVRRAFVYFDVSDYSKHPPGQQLLIVRRLQSFLATKELWNAGPGAAAKERLEASMCTGDGFIFVFANAVDAAWFASKLANIIEERNAMYLSAQSIHFRCGVHVGDVYEFWETSPSGERKNYVGEGINGGSRVLTAIDKSFDDVVYFSGEVRQQIIHVKEAADLLAALHNRGRRADKHGNLWRVYELNHTELRHY